ncbi:hypothetical protein [Frankia sp. AgKG'84/4]|uniref:hypothetical protein n=1 Tax=Frankia sp. AgKG'84/4 TaxID=573490 RepID=UPI00200DB825|nr:hypothetical protein [Frankia sp. AgKG'84/4]MCL9796496.1 hypothetical protein [Frankia sp. AgKG'84/4]
MARIKSAACLEEFGDAIGSLAARRAPTIPILTYAAAVSFFVNNQESAPPDSVGGLLRHRAEAGWLVRLFFLDRDGKPLPADRAPGQSFLVETFDGELDRLLDTRDLIIFSR